ncbi:pilus assembly protein CpaB [Litorimonas taeanensis]|uniref:Pilus assembly protein CpaB n=1 Tax=Litorimonas taeanensis TaxID=568099 RepID=A0A420WM55_9PROT|nr:Flp pilus assembly protein CpaB [Litorimonas taeanensis]RKQ72070.1 pilus assembly protein CpaB [Litorimonas taeanensis]
MDSGKIKKLALLGGLLVVTFVGYKTFLTPEPVVATSVEPVVEQVEYVEVLMASADIPMGAQLNSDLVSWVPWPKESLLPTLITNAEEDRPQAMEEFENANARARYAIFEGEPIIDAKVVLAGDKGVLASLISPGMRAVTTRISVETAAGGFIQPGDRVDVILTEQFDLQRNTQSSNQSSGIVRDEVHISNILFENVQVLAIDQTYATDPEGEPYVIGSSATFELSPADTVLLQEAQSSGELSLTLRGINSSRSIVASKAKKSVYKQEVTPPDLVVYRSGQPQRVAIRGQ